MKDFGDYLAAFSQGANLLRTVPSYKALRAAGFEAPMARYFTIAREVLYAATKYKRHQRAVLSAAIRLGHDVAVLHVIASVSARLKDPTAMWELRKELVLLELDATRMRREANRRLAELQPRVHPRRVAYANHSDGTSSMHITADATTIADLRGHIKSVDDINKLFSSSGHLRPVDAEVTIVAKLDEAVQILSGKGKDLRLRMTNGAIISGADVFNRALSGHLNGVLFHPAAGPINAYRTRRSANATQRMICHAESPTCAWEGCNIPATECQVHHIKAWKQGGNTNARNLACLCKFHNAVNDDDRSGNGWGHVERQGGEIVLVRP